MTLSKKAKEIIRKFQRRKLELGDSIYAKSDSLIVEGVIVGFEVSGMYSVRLTALTSLDDGKRVPITAGAQQSFFAEEMFLSEEELLKAYL